MKKLVLGVLVASCIAACGGSDDGASDPASEAAVSGPGTVVIGPDGVPVGPDGKPLPVKLEGRYELSNRFDLTSAGVLPDAASDTLKALSDFKESPSATMIGLLEAAKVPIVAQVTGLVPGVLKDQLYGFIDDHLFKALYDGAPVTKEIAGLLDDLGTIATKFEVVSTLDIQTPGSNGDATATHQVTGIAFRWLDKRTVVSAPDAVTSFERQTLKVNVVALEKRSADLESGRLELGDQRFTIPLGSFAVLAADKLAQDKLGVANLRAALGKVVDCDAVGEDVANQCVGPVCVGHASDVAALCNAGLDIVVSTVQDRIKALDIPVLHLQSGTAKLWDAREPGGPLDAVADRIDRGFWDATAGKDEHPVVATFTGRRL